ncbi:hypothetical protein L195_g027014 [Trifolium pratense]|uniref:Zinc knuckle CX2CX4HX4C domain-containing protein n=1 Tax=Trifolium pratense TaxID=57577 RepID=A0A2K3KXZ1_TRIPR|nr:hypothetical protein L195_g027014 [Trifolium pratense]
MMTLTTMALEIVYACSCCYEALKKKFPFEKEDEGIVHLHFKYEILGVFCFECGLLGNTESFFPKRLEPDFLDGEKGWGNFICSGNSSKDGGATFNKWLRTGKGQNCGGRNGGSTSCEVVDDNGARDVNLHPSEQISTRIASLELRKQGFFPRGDGDKNFHADNLGRGSGKAYPSPQIPRICPYILNLTIFTNYEQF